MALDKERLKNVTDEEMDLIFRIARLALEVDNDLCYYETLLERSSSEIDTVYVVLEEVINDKEG